MASRAPGLSTASRLGPRLGPRLGALLREHWALAVVLGVAALVRLGVAIAYRPAIFFGDSWAYLDLAFTGSPVSFAPDRPSGYPLLIDLISVPGRSLAAITTLQHAAGMATGVVVYLLLGRLGMPRLVGALGAAVVLLDSYAIALEQQILAEAFFTLALAGAMYLAVGRDRSALSLAASGALLAAATTMRTAAVFAIPVWIVYLVWVRHGLRPLAVAAAGLAAPLLAYFALQAADTGRVGLSQAGGWFLYGRIGEIADCRGADIPAEGRALCERTPRDRREGAAFHIWNADGPARRVFGGISRDPDVQERSNTVLRDFALAIIRDRPGEYAHLVWDDLVRYFQPGEASRGNSDLAITLPERGRLVRRNEVARDRWFPAYEARVRDPAALMRDYQEEVRTPRGLMGLFALASVTALALALVLRLLGRGELPRRREVLLLSGAALAMLLGTAATSEFVLRYLIPVVPLLVCGGIAAVADLGLAAQRALAGRHRGREPRGTVSAGRRTGSRRPAPLSRPRP